MEVQRRSFEDLESASVLLPRLDEEFSAIQANLVSCGRTLLGKLVKMQVDLRKALIEQEIRDLRDPSEFCRKGDKLHAVYSSFLSDLRTRKREEEAKLRIDSLSCEKKEEEIKQLKESIESIQKSRSDCVKKREELSTRFHSLTAQIESQRRDHKQHYQVLKDEIECLKDGITKKRGLLKNIDKESQARAQEEAIGRLKQLQETHKEKIEQARNELEEFKLAVEQENEHIFETQFHEISESIEKSFRARVAREEKKLESVCAKAKECKEQSKMLAAEKDAREHLNHELKFLKARPKIEENDLEPHKIAEFHRLRDAIKQLWTDYPALRALTPGISLAQSQDESPSNALRTCTDSLHHLVSSQLLTQIQIPSNKLVSILQNSMNELS